MNGIEFAFIILKQGFSTLFTNYFSKINKLRVRNKRCFKIFIFVSRLSSLVWRALVRGSRLAHLAYFLTWTKNSSYRYFDLSKKKVAYLLLVFIFAFLRGTFWLSLADTVQTSNERKLSKSTFSVLSSPDRKFLPFQDPKPRKF